MRLRSRKRERPLSGKRNSPIVSKLIKPITKTLTNTSKSAWKTILNRDAAKNGIQDSQIYTRSKNLKTRPVRTVRSMEKPVDSHKTRLRHKEESCNKKPIFQTVVRSSNKDSVTSTKSKTQNDKVTTTSKSKIKDVRTTKAAQLRVNSLNRELRKTETMPSNISSPRKTRRLDKGDKSASLNSSPIRKVRQMGVPSPKVTKTTVSSTDESPKKKSKTKSPVVPETNRNWCNDDNDVMMYEAHTTTVDFPTQKSEESDSDGQVESSELCLPNDCLNDFIAIAECARLINAEIAPEDEDINFLADKAARVMTTEKEERLLRKNSVDKRVNKRRKSSNDLEMYQPTSTTDDLDSCTEFLTVAGEKYVQVSIKNIHHMY